MTNARSFALPLPEGFLGERTDRGWIAVRASEAEALREAGFFDPERIASMGEPTALGGRGSLRRVALPSGPALLRPYLHGGLLRFLTGARFASPERPFRELEISESFRASDLATPRALGAAAFGSLLGHRLYFLSEEVPGVDLLAFLGDRPDPSQRRWVMERVGAAVGQMHHRGWIHADLHPKNLLVAQASTAIYFLDLDRSQRASSPLPQRERVANLARLFRYGERRRALGQSGAWSEQDFLALLAGYEPGNDRALAQALLEEIGRISPIHRMGWSLEKIFAGKSQGS